MKAPQAVKDMVRDTLRAMDSEIQDKEKTLQGYLEVAKETEASVKELKKKRKEYSSFAKKLGVVEDDVGKFIPWDGEIPKVLTDEERNAKLAGITSEWKGDDNVQ